MSHRELPLCQLDTTASRSGFRCCDSTTGPTSSRLHETHAPHIIEAIKLRKGTVDLVLQKSHRVQLVRGVDEDIPWTGQFRHAQVESVPASTRQHSHRGK